MGKSKNRSPPKKRESPKKKIIPNTAAVTVRKDEVEKKYEMVVADDVDGTSDDIKHVVDMKSESFESTSMTTTTTPLTKTQTTTTTTTTSSTESSYCIKRKFSSSAKNTTTSNVTSSTAPIADGAERKILQDGAEETKVDGEVKKFKTSTEKDQMFEHFQPWALKTYGDQAKTKTITYKKKSRILKALDGKEHNNPDSSKFRFWVKSKGFTTKKPESFVDTGNNQDKDTQKDHIDLYVASTTKEFGERAYRKVAVVEQFFDIIYNVHVELGGRGGRHAGQKRTYRIITETYAFLPREAVTKFLTGCPACKKNLRPFSPSRFDEQFTESSSEFEALNYSSQNESSIDSTQLGPIKSIYKIKHENRSRTGTPINKYENISRTGTPVIPTFSESNIETTTTPTTNNNNKVENQDFPKISEIQQNPSTSTANNNLPSSSSSAISIIKSEPVSYFDEIYAKIRNYYKEQGLDNLDINELKSDSNFLNYYQLLKKYCGNSQGQIQQVIPMVTGTTINQNINSKLDCDIKNLSKNFKTPSVTTYFDTKIPQQSDIQISNKNPIFDSSSHSESIDSCIDLRITQSDIKTTVQNPFPHSININIENAVDINDSTDNQYSGNRNNFGNVENSVFINSVDVSINMSNSSNELKISCKTTPPKKRYSVYKPELIETAPKVVTDIVRQPCAMNLIKRFNEPQTSSSCDRIRNVIDINNKKDEELVKPKFQVDLRKVKPITSTYLKMTRSMGLSDEDALKIDDLVSEDFKYTL